jgi:arylsulfatase A-like enzyme
MKTVDTRNNAGSVTACLCATHRQAAIAKSESFSSDIYPLNIFNPEPLNSHAPSTPVILHSTRDSRHLIYILIALIGLIPILLSCANSSTGVSKQSEIKNPNIIIISLDSLRPDHLGCYGYGKPTTPNIDKFAGESILFTNAIAQASWTLASNTSIFTGQYPPTHGLTSILNRLSPGATTLATVLQAYGYKTGAFTGGFHISSIYGVNQGFETYFDEIEHGHLEDVLPRSLEWLKNRPKDKSLFLFLQAYDCHSPHKVPPEYEHLYDPGYDGVMDKFIMDHALGDKIDGLTLTTDDGNKIALTERDINHIVAHYDGALTWADKQLGEFFTHLKKTGLMDNSIIILLGDHGEAHLERGYIIRRKHGGVYEEGIRVPLLIRLPGHLKSRITNPVSQVDTPAPEGRGSPNEVGRQVQLIDIMPTVLEMSGIPVPHTCQGKSIKPLIDGKAPADFNQFVFSFGATNIPSPDVLKRFNKEQFARLKEYQLPKWESCIRSLEWKLLKFTGIEQDKYELYNLKTDPAEKSNLFEEEPAIADKLKGLLEQWEKDVLANKPNVEIDRKLLIEMRERMRKFGYWWVNEETDIPKKKDPDTQDTGIESPESDADHRLQPAPNQPPNISPPAPPPIAPPAPAPGKRDTESNSGGTRDVSVCNSPGFREILLKNHSADLLSGNL